MAKKEYIEELGNGWIRVLKGLTKFNAAGVARQDFAWFKSKFAGNPEMTTDVVQTHKLILEYAAKHAPKEEKKEPKPKRTSTKGSK